MNRRSPKGALGLALIVAGIVLIVNDVLDIVEASR